MNYYLDTEFIECAKQRKVLGFKVGTPVPTIDLISIGLVSEDGREFYALNADCELQYAWDNEWVRKNVLAPIWRQHTPPSLKALSIDDFSLPVMKRLFKEKGLSHWGMLHGIARFVGYYDFMRCPGIMESTVYRHHLKPEQLPVFYGYYCDYDWVVFCQLFGRMIDLPQGFPMYCLDLKQMMHERGLSKEWKQAVYPDPIGEHNALVDAKWNKDLHDKMLNYY